MKKLLICLLVCTLLLSACSFVPTHMLDRDNDDEKESNRSPFVETDIATTAPADYGTVTFDHHYEMQEWAVITCTNQDGSIRWQVETDHYEAAQLSQVVEIGQYQDRYYLIDDSQLAALRMSDGTELWRITDYISEPLEDSCFVDESGTIYLCGFFGPDLLVVDKNGNTLKRVETASNDYCQPYRMDLDFDRNIATLYMTFGPNGFDGIPEGGIPVEVKLP